MLFFLQVFFAKNNTVFAKKKHVTFKKHVFLTKVSEKHLRLKTNLEYLSFKKIHCCVFEFTSRLERNYIYWVLDLVATVVIVNNQ